MEKNWLSSVLKWWLISYISLVLVVFLTQLAGFILSSFSDADVLGLGLLSKYILGFVYHCSAPLYTILNHIDAFFMIRSPIIAFFCNCVIWIGLTVGAYSVVSRIVSLRYRWIATYVIGLWLLTVPFLAILNLFILVDELP